MPVLLFLYQITDESIQWTTKFQSCFLGYHHEEIFYWLSILAKMTSNKGPASHKMENVAPSRR